MSYQNELFTELKRMGLTQQQIAQQLNVSQAMVSQLKNCKVKMPQQITVKIARIIGQPEQLVLASIEAQWADEPEVKNAWLKLATGTAAALVIAPISYLGNFAQCILC
jgi:Helix-turn-helix.